MHTMHTIAPMVLRILAMALLLFGGLAYAGLIKGAFVLRRLTRGTRPDYSLALLKSRLTPAVNLLLAPREMGAPTRELVRRLLGLTFANFEVVVAFNNPSEDELKAWRDEFQMQYSERPITGPCPMGKIRRVLEARAPLRLLALDLEATSAPLAWNAALNTAQSPMIAILDADCDFDARVLRNMIPAMADDPRRVMAVCAASPGQEGATLAQRSVALDYLRSWLTRAAAFSAWNLTTPQAGAAILANREALLRSGGFRAGPLRLILDLHERLRRENQDYRILFLPNAGARRRTPQSAKEVLEAAGEAKREALTCAKSAALPFPLRAGLFSLYVVWPALELLGCSLTLAALAAGWADWQTGALMLLSTMGAGMLISMSAVSLSELSDATPSDPQRLSRLLIAAMVENLGFCQARRWRSLFTTGAPISE